MKNDAWSMTTLGAVTDWSSGGTPSKSNPSFWNGDIPWISASSMKISRLFNSELKITPSGLKNGSRLADKNSILLLVRGSELHKRIPIGIATRSLAFNQDVKALKAKAGLLPEYLLYWFLAAEPLLLSKVEHTGIGAGKLDTNVLKNLTFALPKEIEQQAVTSVLAALDDKIELNLRMNETLEALARSHFKSRFVDAVVTKLPKGWHAGKLRDCCERVENGGTPKRDEPSFWTPGTIPWLTSGEVRQAIVTRSENFISEEGLENSSAKLWPAATTVVALYGATAGQVCFLGDTMCSNQACCGLIPKTDLRYYVYLHASSSVAAFEQQTRGSAQQNLSQQIVADFPTIIPDEETLGEFDQIVHPLFSRWIANLQESRALAELRDALLPKLLSGELRVPAKAG